MGSQKKKQFCFERLHKFTCNACALSTSFQLTLTYFVIINLLVREYNTGRFSFCGFRETDKYRILHLKTGTTVAQWLRCCTTNRKVAGSIPAGVSGFFIDIKSFRSHYGPGVDSASNRNEYQEYFLGVKAAGA